MADDSTDDRGTRGTPPVAAVRPAPFTVHGTTVPDDYAWLKAPNWKAVLKDAKALPAEIGDHLRAENAFTEAAFADLGGLREALVAEMRGRMKEDDSSVPAPDGPFLYFTRFAEGGEQPLFGRAPRNGGPDTILLDGEEQAGDLAYFDFGDVSHSPDHARLAWSADASGSELYGIRVRDLATGEDGAEIVEHSSGDVVWTADSQGFFYVEVDDNHRPVRVRLHRLGTPPAEDPVVYEEPDPGWFVDIGRTASRRFLVIALNDHETSEARLVDLSAPGGPPRLVAARAPGVLYDVDHGAGNRLVIRTNDGAAEDFKLVTAPLDDPARANWTDLVPHRAGTMILDHHLLAGHLVRLERRDANQRIVVRALTDGAEHAIAFPDEAYGLSLEGGYEFETTTIRFVYSSMKTPRETYDYDCDTRERVLRKRQEVPSGFDPAAYETRRITALAPDGAEVPISLVHRAGLPLDGSAPCFLYGYGSYGHAVPATFRTNPLSLVDRGFVFAIAHVRGGTEKGWGWYTDGKKNRKPNTFTDFLACADKLVEDGYTARGRIVGYGGSAGGMLVGAVANLGADRFAGIVADVPFVDVLNTMLDGELPLTPPEWPEWGNPGPDETAFRTILGYSPYDNVRPQPYPAILALGGLTDPRVTYWEPAKWVARLRATMTAGGPVFMQLNMDAGHGGASGRFEQLDEIAMTYAFAIRCVNEGWSGAGV